MSRGDFHRARLDRQAPLGQADVVVVSLVPATGDTDAIGHCMNLSFRVAEHVAHHHSAIAGPHVVDVDRHCFEPPIFVVIQNRLMVVAISGCIVGAGAG